jgi:glycine/serine hydroxymethyltransferase
VFGITLSREQSCRTAEPVIITVHFTAFKRCVEVVTFFCGAAKADAQIAIDMATVANLVTVVILQGSAFSVPMARENAAPSTVYS